MADGKKAHLSIVVCGHVDAGKSTTTGRLLLDLGGIDDRALEKLKAEAKAQGKDSFFLAFFMDNNKEERERGVTIACNVKEFFTDNYHYSIIDAPGHRDFIKNMITGSSQADVALLLVPADGNFTTSIQKGNPKAGEVQGQTRQHARLLKLLGVNQLIVGINKMDASTAKFAQSRYDEVKAEAANCLTKVGWSQSQVDNTPFVAMSGWTGDNIVKKSDKMPWYKGTDVTNAKGEKLNIHTLLDALNLFVYVPDRDASGSFRMPVGGVCNIKGVGTVITGRVERGSIGPEQKVMFPPTHNLEAKTSCLGKTFSVERHKKKIDAAEPGDNVGICVKGLNKENMPKNGDVMVLEGDELACVKEFTIQCQVIDHQGQLKKGYTPIAYCRTARSAVKMTAIKWKLGKKTGGQKVEGAPFIEANEVGELVFEPQQPFVVECFLECEGLGRIAIMEGNTVVMLGKVVEVVYVGGRKVSKPIVAKAPPAKKKGDKGKKGKKDKKEKKKGAKKKKKK